MTAPGAPGDQYTALLVALARLEGKLDAALAAQSTKVDEHGRRLDDIEPRVRAVESRPSVSPRMMLAGLGTVAGLVGAISPFLDRLYS